ncbi:unnamed protein product, partial [Brassica rapa]
DGLVSSPLRRPHALKKQWEDLGSCSTVAQRHRFLLTAVVPFGIPFHHLYLLCCHIRFKALVVFRDDREREGDVSNRTCSSQFL